MANFAVVGKASELPEGAMREVSAQGHEILLARVKDKYYAADNHCPHLRANLSRGKLNGMIVTCPSHASQFDLADGQVIRWTDWSGLKAKLSNAIRPPRPLKVYNVKVEDDSILVEI